LLLIDRGLVRAFSIKIHNAYIKTYEEPANLSTSIFEIILNWSLNLRN